MKLVYDEGEKEKIQSPEIELDKIPINIFSDCSPEKEYSINFTVTNPEIAQFILMSMLNHDKSVDIDLGIDIKSINFTKWEDNASLKKIFSGVLILQRYLIGWHGLEWINYHHLKLLLIWITMNGL